MPESKPKGEVKKTVTEKNTPKIIPMAGVTKPEPPKKEEVPKPTTPGEKKPEPPKKEEAPKPAAPGEKKPEPPKKEETPKPAAPGEKKPEPPKKEEAPKPAAPGEKKPEPPKKEDSPKPTAPGEKKPEPPKKGETPKPATPGEKKPEVPNVVDPKPKDTAVAPFKGITISHIFADRLDKPTDADLKSLPIPKEGEGYFMRLHPSYFFEFLDHPFSVNRETQDYKELFDSIKENGINEPAVVRPRPDGGVEIISGHRRHDVAEQLNYPVPIILVQMDDDTARIEVVDGNLHRKDIPTSELARATKMKLEAMARKAGRRSKMEQLVDGPKKRTDEIVAEEMGMSRNQVQRLVRIDLLTPELKKKVDDKTLPFNTAVELSYLNETEQQSVADFMEREQVVPSLAQAQALKTKSQEAAKAAKGVKSAGAIHSHNYQSSLPPSIKSDSPTSIPQPAEKKPPAPAPVTDKTIASVMKPKKGPELKVTLSWEELRSYFGGKQPSVPEAKRAIFDALDMRKAELAKKAQKPGKTTPAR